jgi:hypothetical protein
MGVATTPSQYGIKPASFHVFRHNRPSQLQKQGHAALAAAWRVPVVG